MAVAPEGRPQLGSLAHVDGRLRFERGEVLVDPSVDGQSDHVAGRLADVRHVEQLPGAVQTGTTSSSPRSRATSRALV